MHCYLLVDTPQVSIEAHQLPVSGEIFALRLLGVCLGVATERKPQACASAYLLLGRKFHAATVTGRGMWGK